MQSPSKPGLDAPLLDLQEVTHRFAPSDRSATCVLDRVTFRADRGDSIAIIGPSGSGKSTLLNIIGGLMRPTSGMVRLDGIDHATLNPDELARMRNRRIGFVFQSHQLLPQLTALENVLVPTVVFRDGRRPAELRDRAMGLLDRVGVAALASRRPGRLSGGECQRVAVVRALINQPSLLLADEPTGSLDARTAQSIGALFETLNRDDGLTVIVVTHSEALARGMSTRYRLTDGSLADDGAAQ